MSNFYEISEIHWSKVQLQRTIFSIQSVALEVVDLLKPEGGAVFSFEIPICSKTETAIIEPTLSGVGISSRICGQPGVVDTESEYTI